MARAYVPSTTPDGDWLIVKSFLLSIECDIFCFSLRPFFFELFVVMLGGGIDLNDWWFSALVPPPTSFPLRSLRVADETLRVFSWGSASVCKLVLSVC